MDDVKCICPEPNCPASVAEHRAWLLTAMRATAGVVEWDAELQRQIDEMAGGVKGVLLRYGVDPDTDAWAMTAAFVQVVAWTVDFGMSQMLAAEFGRAWLTMFEEALKKGMDDG